MSDTQRRRFPLFELIAVTSLAIGMIIAARALELIPHGVEIWIDLESLQVEHRWQVCGLCIEVTREDYWNDAAEYYAAAGIDFGEQKWGKSSTMYWLLRKPSVYYTSRLDERSQYVRLELALFMISQFVHDSSNTNGWGKRFELSEPAREELMAHFLQISRCASESPEVVLDYVKATEYRFREAGPNIDSSDIIKSEIWLADPVPEHYYGAERIH